VGNGRQCVADDVGIDDGKCSLMNDAGVYDIGEPMPCSKKHINI
jgi:hypothetical protein